LVETNAPIMFYVLAVGVINNDGDDNREDGSIRSRYQPCLNRNVKG